MKKSLIINRLKLSDFVFSLTLVLELKNLLSSGRQRKVSGKFYGTNMKLGKERKKRLEKYRKNYGFSQSFLLGFFLGLSSKIFRAIAAITISLLCHLNPCWKGKKFSSFMNICLLLLLLHCTKNKVSIKDFFIFCAVLVE